MLLKLAVTSAEDHVAQYKTKITHCDGSIKMADYFKKLLLDNGENLKTENILEVLVGAGSFTDISLFDTMYGTCFYGRPTEVAFKTGYVISHLSYKELYFSEAKTIYMFFIRTPTQLQNR